MDAIKPHDTVLQDSTEKGLPIKLRPMTEADWPILEKWNSDPEVLFYSEGDNVTAYSPEMVRRIYRGVCANAYCFIIEADGRPVGECWLQNMNLEWILKRHPDKDCRRIDLMIGEKDCWGKGIGTAVLKLLTGFGFRSENADLIFGCSIWDYNPGSLDAMKKAGYEPYHKEKLEAGRKGKYEITMVLSKERYFSDREQ